MRNKFLIGAVALLAGIVILLLSRGCRPEKLPVVAPDKVERTTSMPSDLSPSPSVPSSPENPAAVQEAKFERAYEAPITFYGLVVDQNDNPIAGANVEMQANDKPWERGTPHHTTSNKRGEFSITGISGLSLYVNVSKDGYYRVLTREGKLGSDGGFAYGTNLGDGVHRPDSQKPVVFIFAKIGNDRTLV